MTETRVAYEAAMRLERLFWLTDGEFGALCPPDVRWAYMTERRHARA